MTQHPPDKDKHFRIHKAFRERDEAAERVEEAARLHGEQSDEYDQACRRETEAQFRLTKAILDD